MSGLQIPFRILNRRSLSFSILNARGIRALLLLGRAGTQRIVDSIDRSLLHSQSDDDTQHRQHQRNNRQHLAIPLAAKCGHGADKCQHGTDESQHSRGIVDDWYEAQYHGDDAENQPHNATYRDASIGSLSRSHIRHRLRCSMLIHVVSFFLVAFGETNIMNPNRYDCHATR